MIRRMTINGTTTSAPTANKQKRELRIAPARAGARRQDEVVNANPKCSGRLHAVCFNVGEFSARR
jgi:hypothetical protein